MTPTFAKLNLTIGRADSIRSVASPVTSTDCQNMISLLSGLTVEARVYSGTNKCFDVTEEMIRTAWAKIDKESVYWIAQTDVDRLVERFTTVNEHGNTLAMTLPNLCCVETPAEIEELLTAARA